MAADDDQIGEVLLGVARRLLRDRARFGDEARQLNQQAAGYADRIVLPHQSVNELVEELLSTCCSEGDHLVGQVSHKSAANAKTSPAATSSAMPASLAAFRSATGVVWGVFGDRRDSFGRSSTRGMLCSSHRHKWLFEEPSPWHGT